MLNLHAPFRRARIEDARALAELIDLAGEGIPAMLWAASARGGEAPIDVGMRRAARTGVPFSFENAVVGEDAGRVTAMILGYPIDDADPGDLSHLPEIIRPLVRLECMAPGSWYVNALAVRPEYRRQGLGTRLLRIADALAAEEGRITTSLIVSDGNLDALRLYDREGYRVAAGETMVPRRDLQAGGRWLLMTRPVVPQV